MRHLCVLTVMLSLGCLPKPTAPALLSVEPTVLDTNVGGALTLVGASLLPVATLDFDQPARSTVQPAAVSAFLIAGATRVELLDVSWVDATRVTARLAAPVDVGTYDVHLIEPKGSELVLLQALSVLDCATGDCPLPDGGMPDSGVVTCGTSNYRDLDLDGFGAGTASNRCGPGWVPVAGDCDDRDPLTNPSAPEVCNGLDDNCNGQVDEGRCADAGWTSVDTLRGSTDLLASVSFAPGSLWIAAGTKLFVRRGELGFADVSLGCPSEMKALWAEDGGEVELAGGATVAAQSFDTPACSNARAVPGAMVAITGIPTAATAQYFGVLGNGQLLHWRRGEAPVAGPPSTLSSSDQVFDLHGSSPTELYAVGVTQNGNSRRLAVWALQPDGRWSSESLSGVEEPQGTLRALWVLSPTDIVAVGDDGTVIRKTASGWRRVESDTGEDLTSVRAFSTGRFYVSQADGRVRRRARGAWQTVFRSDGGVRLNDLSGTGEEDLWAVGNGGVIGRGPH